MSQKTRIYQRHEVRKVDQLAIEQYGIPSLVLMENAARSLAQHTRDQLDLVKGQRILILCGSGNNAGDGLAAARHLHNAGLDIVIALTRPIEKFSSDAAVHFHIARQLDLPIIGDGEDPIKALSELHDFDLMLDALLGTGIDQAVRSPIAEVIEWINKQPQPVVAADIPSGLDCDEGVPLGDAVQADLTVSFVGWKQGFLNPESKTYTGRILTADIGAPRAVVESLGRPHTY